MPDEYLEISDTGRAADREGVGLLEGRKQERRRMALTFLLLTRADHPRAAAWLDGKRLKPSAAELAEVQREFDAVLEREREQEAVA